MNPDFWKAVGTAVGTLIGVPLMVFVWRGGAFFGAFRETMKAMTTFVQQATNRLDEHDEKFESHDSRIQRIEDERRMEEKFGRRHQARRTGDPRPTDEPEL
jgi:hypothetical protein